MTRAQLKHNFLLFAALYASESWHHNWRMGYTRALYCKTRAMVTYDRVLNQDFK
jgi:hypothetical protein